MAGVVLKSGESQESLLRRFRRKIKMLRSGILRDVKRKRQWRKQRGPSWQRRSR